MRFIKCKFIGVHIILLIAIAFDSHFVYFALFFGYEMYLSLRGKKTLSHSLPTLDNQPLG